MLLNLVSERILAKVAKVASQALRSKAVAVAVVAVVHSEA